MDAGAADPLRVARPVPWSFRPRSYVVDYFGPREPIRGCETTRPRSFLAHAERTFSRSCGRGVTASALRHFETVASSARASAREPRRGHRGQADSDRAASAAAERDRLLPHSPGATRMNDSASRDRKSESCLQFLRGARNLSRRPRDKGRRERRSASARPDRGAHQTPE
uniref:Uncharacterized protein n=1 Tax=Heliothis virescens TaxID=7102 RepID=A0A2A4J5P5_HELVI